jgi:hypothetical protein
MSNFSVLLILHCAQKSFFYFCLSCYSTEFQETNKKDILHMASYRKNKLKACKSAGLPATATTVLAAQTQPPREHDEQLCSRSVPVDDFKHGTQKKSRHYQNYQRENDEVSSFLWGTQKKVALS